MNYSRKQPDETAHGGFVYGIRIKWGIPCMIGEQGLLTPIVRNGKQATVGYQPEIWKGWEERQEMR